MAYMPSRIEHNGTNITGFVRAYERVHKVCTGIGTLTVEVVNTINREFDPWDTIDIHENGDFKVRYYISSTMDSVPEGIIRLECQDISKRLVDYFIPESYTIDYPSYTRTWIEQFLTEAGLTYEFTTTSPGQLISNYTQLGLAPAYEQILMLLQMSGWYIFFDGNGKAIIGELSTELSDVAGTLDKPDILSISRIEDDKMLRNRAVVWGSFDPIYQEYSYADVSVQTPWNYDSSDLRTMVISNNNIPNKSSAYGMANQLIKEFARITVEKHIIAHGARNYTLGRALNVKSNVWTGRGLITTFGVTMNKDGLVTNIILDERCPRLFGFFNFGDYVYVGTYGAGIWRKHIRFDPTWYDFSAGLTDLNATDLHINHGVFGAVTASGDAWYTLSSEGPWVNYDIPYLESTRDSEAEISESGVFGSGVILDSWSGIMTRATIIDKVSNYIKYGVDNISGILNYGDYFLSLSGWYGLLASGQFEIISGIYSFSGSSNRGWIVEVNPFDLSNEVFPIHVEGNFEIAVIDLENDGRNDYVSVRLGTDLPPVIADGNYGEHVNQPFASVKDNNALTLNPVSVQYVNDTNATATANVLTDGNRNLIAYDNQVANLRKVVSHYRLSNGTHLARLYRWEIVEDEETGERFVSSSTVGSSAAVIPSSGGEFLAIHPISWSADQYRIYYKRMDNTVNPWKLFYCYKDWDAYNNTVTDEVQIGQAGVIHHTASVFPSFTGNTVVVNGVIYDLLGLFEYSGTTAGFRHSPAYLEVDIAKIDMASGGFQYGHLLSMETEIDDDTGPFDIYEYFRANEGSAESENPERNIFRIFQDGDGVKILGFIETYGAVNERAREYLVAGDDSVLQYNNIYDGTGYRYPFVFFGYSQITADKGVAVWTGLESGDTGFFWNGTTRGEFVTINTGETLVHLDSAKIFPVLDYVDKYIYMDSDGNYNLADANNMSPLGLIEPPAGKILVKPFGTMTGTFGRTIYFLLDDEESSQDTLMPYDLSSFYPEHEIAVAGLGSMSTAGLRVVHFGGFFIQDWNESVEWSNVLYVDLGLPGSRARFLVLQRDGYDYRIIQEEIYPIRLDISNNSPVLTAGSGEMSFTSNFISDTELSISVPTGLIVLGSGMVDDYRYSYLETTTSGTLASGNPISIVGLYIHNSGIMMFDTRTYESGFMPAFDVPSGYGTRIETSNNVADGQYVFITASGDYQTFYQKDPGSVAFVEYSGLPNPRATIIRLDDVI